MTDTAFSLRRFPGPGPHAGLVLDGVVSRTGVRFSLRGDLAPVVAPPPADLPCRRDGLWRTTCFEVLLARESDPGYQEFNLAPAGDWNVYRFSGYREGMTEDPTIASIEVESRRLPDRFELAATWVPAAPVPGADTVVAGVSAVLASPHGTCSYWALAHGGPRPDFHWRGGFLLRV